MWTIGECAANYYCPAASVTSTACPVHTESVPGSSVISNCTCIAGYEGDDGGPCHECAIGRYKSTKGMNNTCHLCPLNATTITNASTSIDDCLCQMGYTSSNERSSSSLIECRACISDYYKSWIGPEPCLKCPSNSSSTGGVACACDIGFSLSFDHHRYRCIPLTTISNTLHLVHGIANYSYDIHGTPNELMLPSLVSENNVILGFQTSGTWTLSNDNEQHIRSDVNMVMFTFGSSASIDQQQRCHLVNVVTLDNVELISNVTCVIPNGYGHHLLFHMWLIDNQTAATIIPRRSPPTIHGDMFSYPTINIAAQTLRRGLSVYGSDLLIAATNFLSESISFDGVNFITDARYVHVTYGPMESPSALTCSLIDTSSTTTLTCKTQESLVTGKFCCTGLRVAC
jgi:hypothetical protein